MRLPNSIDPIIVRERRRLAPIDRSTRNRRLRIGILTTLIGICLAGIGFFDISIWNTESSHSYGVALFVIGCVGMLVGLGIVCFAFPQLFDIGDRGI